MGITIDINGKPIKRFAVVNVTWEFISDRKDRSEKNNWYEIFEQDLITEKWNFSGLVIHDRPDGAVELTRKVMTQLLENGNQKRSDSTNNSKQ